jgi:hypothetical protein
MWSELHSRSVMVAMWMLRMCWRINLVRLPHQGTRHAMNARPSLQYYVFSESERCPRGLLIQKRINSKCLRVGCAGEKESPGLLLRGWHALGTPSRISV